MSDTCRPIPGEEARSIGERYGKRVVVIFTLDETDKIEFVEYVSSLSMTLKHRRLVMLMAKIYRKLAYGTISQNYSVRWRPDKDN